MIKSGLCLFSLLGSSVTLPENEYMSITLMIQFLTTQSTALLSKSSQYKDNNQRLLHLHELSLVLNKQYEYLMSTNTNANYYYANVTDGMLETFRKIMKKTKYKKTKLMKRRQKIT